MSYPCSCCHSHLSYVQNILFHLFSLAVLTFTLSLSVTLLLLLLLHLPVFTLCLPTSTLCVE